MSTIVLGCDKNGHNDKECQDTVAKILEKAGHKVEKLTISSSAFGNSGYKKSMKGKIGIYLMAASLVSVTDVPSTGWYYKYTYFCIRGDVSKINSQKKFDSTGIPKDHHGDCRNSLCDKWEGKTYPEINEIIKNKGQVVFGGITPKEMGNALVKALGGEKSTSSKSSKESTGGSIKEALKKAVSKWDGDVSIHCIGDSVYVGKIPDPSKTSLLISEYDNALYDNVNVVDINPNTINYLTCTYKKYTLTLKDDMLIKRFGAIKKNIKCPSSVKSLKDAEAFLQREFNKIRRDDGRSVECKIRGASYWRSGVWVQVYLPSYFIDDYMYISKCSHEEDGTNNWLTSLTLVDYPPSFGVEETTDEES